MTTITAPATVQVLTPSRNNNNLVCVVNGIMLRVTASYSGMLEVSFSDFTFKTALHYCERLNREKYRGLTSEQLRPTLDDVVGGAERLAQFIMEKQALRELRKARANAVECALKVSKITYDFWEVRSARIHDKTNHAYGYASYQTGPVSYLASVLASTNCGPIEDVYLPAGWQALRGYLVELQAKYNPEYGGLELLTTEEFDKLTSVCANVEVRSFA